MKKYIVFIIALFLISSNGLLAQDRTLKQVMELQMPKTADDELCGTRGAGVCWNPITKKILCCILRQCRLPYGCFYPYRKKSVRR